MKYYIMKNCFNDKISLYVYVSLIMKYQQLQMGFLNSKNSNKNSLYYL